MRAPTTLALVLAVFAPSLARAQQPPIPPVGEPPPPETRMQEQAAIQNQVSQEYEQAHKQEHLEQATREVEQERRSAWEQRGRDLIPPPVSARLPGGEANIAARMGTATGMLGFGISAALKLRMKRWWGLEAAGGFLSFRDVWRDAPPNAHFPALFAEVSGFAWSPSGSMFRKAADHVVFRTGTQVLFPLGRPDMVPVYLAPFAGIGGTIAFGPLYKGKGYAAILFESRLGYRFGLGSPASPLQGWMVDLITGPVVGF